jgi:hypothetical protein
MTNYYSLLQIDSKAAPGEIELALEKYRDNLLKYGGGLQMSDEEMKSRFPDYYEAKTTLGDPEKRKAYDLQLQSLDQYEKGAEPDRSKRHLEEITLIKYSQLWFTHTFSKIAGWVGLGITVILWLLYMTLLFAGSRHAFNRLPVVTAYTAGIIILSLTLIYASRILVWLHPPKDLLFKNNRIYVEMPGGKTLAVTKIVLYRYILKDILYINVFTEAGRMGIYTGYDTSFRLQTDRHGLISYGLKASVPVLVKPFLFFNMFLEK